MINCTYFPPFCRAKTTTHISKPNIAAFFAWRASSTASIHFSISDFIWFLRRRRVQNRPRLNHLERATRLPLTALLTNLYKDKRHCPCFDYIGTYTTRSRLDLIHRWDLVEGGLSVWLPMPKSHQSYVRSQHPPAQWNLRGGRRSSVA